MKILHAFASLPLVLSLAACSVGRIIREQKVQAPAPDGAVVVAGVRLADSGEPDAIKAAALSLFVGREFQGGKGVIRKGAGFKPFKGSFGVKNARREFLVSDEAGFAYRVWEVPKDVYAADGASLLYPQYVGNKKVDFSAPNSGTTMVPPLGFVPAKKGPGPFTFRGCGFKIDGPGVYYLGEFGFSGSVTMERSFWKGSLAGAKFLLNNGADKDLLQKFLASNGLSGAALRDVSESCRELPGTVWFDYFQKRR